MCEYNYLYNYAYFSCGVLSLCDIQLTFGFNAVITSDASIVWIVVPISQCYLHIRCIIACLLEFQHITIEHRSFTKNIFLKK